MLRSTSTPRRLLVQNRLTVRRLLIADIVPTGPARAEGNKPRIRSSPARGAAVDLRRLDERMTQTHDVRLWATLILVGSVLGGALLAFAFRSRYLGRAGVLAAPAVLAASLLLSAVAITRPSTVVFLLAGITVGGALLVAVPGRLLPYAPVA